MRIQTEEEWMEEIFRDDCVCAIVDLTIENGDTYKFGVAITKSADNAWGDGKFTHNAGSYIFQSYNDWYTLKKDYKVTRVTHSEFLKAINRKGYEVGSSVNSDHGVFLISSNNAEQRRDIERQRMLDQYELDHEDDF